MTTPSSRTRALLGLGCIVLVVAWGVLVRAAIDFGRAARGGQGSGWLFLAMASLGAIACLFAGLLVCTRLLVAFGAISEAPPVVGGRRAKR